MDTSMNIEHIDIKSEKFDEMVEDIKQRNLSRNNMPKLVVGTGLSAIYGVPGMRELAEHLEKEINNLSDENIIEIWKKHSSEIKTKGLEVGLANLAQSENDLVDAIKIITSKYILESEERLHKDIREKDTGFCRLLDYLQHTVSVDRKIIDIMTPNYDRIIEIICDKLGIGVITGFYGNLYGKFNRKLLKQPSDFYNCRNCAWVRLFKPHGSINWISDNRDEYLTNDYHTLMDNVEYIEIVTPGSSKYKVGMINNTLRCMREDFNDLLIPGENYSLLVYGYGFNDEHFDTVLFDSFQRNVLILSRDVKPNIINRALEKKNITVFYHENGIEYMIYKSRKYTIDLPVWDIDQFANLFIG
jgi:hypothetical protein